ncbi:hypothetical protein BH10ACT8_BH10ACT8_04040 [soil metagenome]
MSWAKGAEQKIGALQDRVLRCFALGLGHVRSLAHAPLNVAKLLPSRNAGVVPVPNELWGARHLWYTSAASLVQSSLTNDPAGRHGRTECLDAYGHNAACIDL